MYDELDEAWVEQRIKELDEMTLPPEVEAMLNDKERAKRMLDRIHARIAQIDKLEELASVNPTLQAMYNADDIDASLERFELLGYTVLPGGTVITDEQRIRRFLML